MRLLRPEDIMAKRIAKALEEIQETGTFDIDTDELEFGAKLAWRNASRCPGRIQWQNLKLFDCRSVRVANPKLHHH